MESSKRQRLQNDDISEITCSSENEVTGVVRILQNQPNHSSMKILTICCNVSVDNVRLIANVLKINKSIIGLSIGNGRTCSQGVVAIVEALSDYNNTILTKLDIYRYYNTINYTAIVAIGRMIKTNNSLTELNLSGCLLNADGATVIGDSLKVNTTLERLHLRSNNIRDVDAVAIANGIAENGLSSLSVLNLNKNNIGSMGARSIATLLTSNKSLTALNLDGNEMIGTDGVVVIAEAMKHNKSLAILILGDIPFGDEGARSIESLLRTNVSLKELHMWGCGIGDAGVAAITDALRTNKSLKTISLGENPISNSVIANELAPMLEINTTLIELDFGNHNEPMDNVAAGSMLKTLEDYNDTVYTAYCSMYNSFVYSPNVRLLLGKISAISAENRKGCRIAPFSRRGIFNNLKSIWVARTHDT
jgi:Ran GTPase-activating protein (RanGAP) involved in mRNA processing and transport